MKPLLSEFKKRDQMLQLLGLARPDRGDGQAPSSFDLGGEASRQLSKDWQRTVSQENEVYPAASRGASAQADGETRRSPGSSSAKKSETSLSSAIPPRSILAKAGENVYDVAWRNPDESISLTATVNSFKQSPGIDYLVHIANHGKQDTPIFENILPLDITFDVNEVEPINLYYAKGSSCAIDDFLPLETKIVCGKPIALEPNGGRSSCGILPFFNLVWKGGGLMIAVGWSGQWIFKVQRDVGSLRIQAGMAKTHLLLHPGECIRTPRILLVCWEGKDRYRGHNLFRQLMLTHYCPRVDGKSVLPPVAYTNAASIVLSGKPANEASQLEAINKLSQLGIEAYWMDAYWYPQKLKSILWSVGTWIPRKKDFPQGLRALSDAAHKSGLKFVLWYEPERVMPGTKIYKEHPEFLLKLEGVKFGFLFNLGIPEARRYMTDLLSDGISRYGVDIYRQDFNFDPLPFWQAADTPNRTGITEIRYIEGLYEMWRELLKRHPGLAIDNCASGGRRIDLETCSLSLPLWRSDFADLAHFKAEARKVVQIANQVHNAGLSLFVPLHAGPVSTHDFYSFCSAMSAGVNVYSDVRLDDFPRELAIKGIEKLKELRPYTLGDFYPLTPVTTDPAEWCAYQYHRQDMDAGFAVYFCREQCKSLSLPAKLRELDPLACYQVITSKDYDDSQSIQMKGAKLSSLQIKVASRPGAVLLKYERTNIGGKDAE